jgi:pyruvate/2-oxoglutarate dehydrogenase complex dihydrolipoamide dehydrogenase (E3) component
MQSKFVGEYVYFFWQWEYIAPIIKKIKERFMANYDYDIGVIGGGSAGLTIAAGSAMAGAKTLLIEKESHLGGDCLHYGCVPSKTLIKSAHVYHEMKNMHRYGLPSMQSPAVDFNLIARRIQDVIDTIQVHDSAERFCSLGARVEFGEARFIDPYTVQVGAQAFSANKWVIATGSSPAIPKIEGLAETPYLTNRDIFSLDHLPESLVVLGGGPIGKEDKDLADIVMQSLQEEGVVFHLNSSVVRVRDLGTGREVTVRAGDVEHTLQSEMFLVAAGRELNLANLGLETIGVEYDRHGLALDARLRTIKHSHIFGAGDVTGQYLFTHAAGYEGGVVIRNAIFHLPSKVDYATIPWCTYTDPELASIGMNEKSAKTAGVNYTVWTEPFKNNDRSLAEGEKVGLIKMLLDDKEHLLGVQILGPHAGDLISEWVAIMNGSVKLSTVASSIHPYPTLGEINKRVIGNFLSGKIYSETMKSGLKFFFNLRGRACNADEHD